MKLKELIEKLQEHLPEHADAEVYIDLWQTLNIDISGAEGIAIDVNGQRLSQLIDTP